jgi:hypothetical protein
LQIVYQQPGGKQKSEIMPYIQWFSYQERKIIKEETVFQPPYLVEPQYIEGRLEGEVGPGQIMDFCRSSSRK